jgi:hypothetical protein
MLSDFAAAGALVVALIIGLGRQVTVFTVFEPGLWLFRSYRRKRNHGLLLVAALSATALLIGPGPRTIPLVMASGILSGLALVFNLEILFPALRRVRVIPAPEAAMSEAAAELLPDDNARVVVVEHGDETRAYPLERMVMARHLIHDVVGSTPLVVTYCALCRTGLVFRAGQEDRTLTFDVVGVFRRNLMMEDAQTRTLWQQATGEAIYGPLAGQTLELLPAVQMPWNQAKQWSGMTLAVEPEGARWAALATRRGFALLEKATERVMAPGRTRLSTALPRREPVFGIRIDGHAKAYPISRIRSLGAFYDRAGGVDLDLHVDEVTDTLSAHRRDGAADPIVEKHWWLGWNEFHPDTEIYD